MIKELEELDVSLAPDHSEELELELDELPDPLDVLELDVLLDASDESLDVSDEMDSSVDPENALMKFPAES